VLEKPPAPGRDTGKIHQQCNFSSTSYVNTIKHNKNPAHKAGERGGWHYSSSYIGTDSMALGRALLFISVRAT
jgi:hypothetical protein